MNKFIKKNNEVYFFKNKNLKNLTIKDIDNLKKISNSNDSGKVRICSHSSEDDLVHEMLIIHTNECFVRPHKHNNKSESLFMIEGEADLIFFDNEGEIVSVFEMGQKDSGKIFYQHIPNNVYHTLIIKTKFLIFNEVTEGPFERDNTEFPYWAPALDNFYEIKKFNKHIHKSISSFKNHG